MSHSLLIDDFSRLGRAQADRSLAQSITKAASQQTYYTIRFLVDRNMVDDAFRAYSYFRWVDDWLDAAGRESAERLAFVNRQTALINSCYRGDPLGKIDPEEDLLVELIRSDHEKSSGLRAYIYNMMAVMAFDAGRRGRLITQQELTDYSHNLAAAVTEALHYFIGHRCRSPQDGTRYLAVTAAHITHMLRDALDDAEHSYFNIPREYLAAQHIDALDVGSEPYRRWVENRVQLARAYFKAGIGYLRRVDNPRCRLAGYAYMARFQAVLEMIEQDGYILRSEYPQSQGIGACIRLCSSTLALTFRTRHPEDLPRAWQVR